jgi:DcmR-like sensory protein
MKRYKLITLDEKIKAKYKDHIAFFYKYPPCMTRFTKFIEEGLRRGEKCYLIFEEEGVEIFKEALKKEAPDIEHLLYSDLFSAYRYKDKFDPDEMIGIKKEIVREIRRKKYTHVRGIEEVATHSQEARDLFPVYESKSNYICESYPITSICQYRADGVSKAEKIDALKTHPSFLIEDHFVERNPFYINPDEFLEKFGLEKGVVLSLKEDTENAIATIIGGAELILEEGPQRHNQETLRKVELLRKAGYLIKEIIEKL